MFKMTDLRLGTKVLVFDTYHRTSHEATIVGLDLDGDIKIRYDDSEYDSEQSKYAKHLNLYDYKANLRWWSCGSEGFVWCFPDATKYINFVREKFKGEKLHKKSVFADYDKYNHDNNKNQQEVRLNKQRIFINKIMEQGYVYGRINSGGGWVKHEHPEITFRDKNYYVTLISGYVKATKEGTTLSLTDPTKKD